MKVGISRSKDFTPVYGQKGLNGFAFFPLILFQLSFGQPQLARQSQEKLIVSTGFWKEGQQIVNTLQEDDRLGKGGVAWLSVGMLTFGFTPCHITQPLYFSARSHPAGKKCSNFAQSLWGYSFPSYFLNSRLWI